MRKMLIVAGHCAAMELRARRINAEILELYQLEDYLKPERCHGKRGKKGKAKKDWQQ